MNALDVETAIKRHTQGALIFPEAPIRFSMGIVNSQWGGPAYESFGDYFADFLMLSDVGYATEIEVKVSRSDWKADLSKPKWAEGRFPPWIARFVYAVPKELGIPDFVPPTAGVWHITARGEGYAYLEVARAPKRIGKEKVPQDQIDRWMRGMYYRYWNMRAERRNSLFIKARTAQTAGPRLVINAYDGKLGAH